MFALLKFMTLKQFKTAGFWIGILLPAIVIGLFFNYLDYSELKTDYTAIAISTGISISVILGWGQVFSMVKTSSLLKGIQMSNIRKRELFMLGFISSLIMFIVSSLIVVGTAILYIHFGIIEIWGKDYTYEVGLFPEDFAWVQMSGAEYLSKIDWLAFVWGIGNIWVLSSLFSFFVASISKTQTMYQTITWSYMLMYIFFGGFIVPVDLLRMPVDSDEAMVEYVFTSLANLVPTSWTNFYMADTMTKAIYILPEGSSIDMYWPYNAWQTAMTWYMPLVWGGVFAGVGLYWVRYWN